MAPPSASVCRVRQRGLHGEAHPDAQEPLPGAPEDGGAEEERGPQRGHQRRPQRRRPGPPGHAQADGEYCLWVAAV